MKTFFSEEGGFNELQPKYSFNTGTFHKNNL